jgi:hypothetical protein
LAPSLLRALSNSGVLMVAGITFVTLTGTLS